jgi:N-acetylmuramoyl-L-alanine amidase
MAWRVGVSSWRAWGWVALAAVMVALSGLATTLERPVAAPAALVVIDAGHGGPDPGAVSAQGVREADLNLVVAADIANDLRLAGVTVVMTRTGDTALTNPFSVRRDLLARSAVANRVGAGVLVSIHINTESTGTVHGPIVYYPAGRPASNRLANLLEQQLAVATGTAHRPRPAHFFVLWTARVPAALVELGFLTHAQDARQLEDPAYQQLLAAAITRAILNFLHGTPT